MKGPVGGPPVLVVTSATLLLAVSCARDSSGATPNIAPPAVDASVDLRASCRQSLCGYVDSRGGLVIPRLFKRAMPFYEGLASVYLDKVGWGVIDRSGSYVVKPTFASIGPFSEGLAAAQPDEKDLYRWIYIDRAGKTVIELPFQVQFAFPFHAGKAWISVPYWFAQRSEAIDRTGRVIERSAVP
jgi:hypothetical protein